LARRVSALYVYDIAKLTLHREHSKTIGGIPVASDVFLFQKQQTFNRSKNLERMVHPSGSGAFGYFECTNDVTGLTVCHLDIGLVFR
jgi:catalase